MSLNIFSRKPKVETNSLARSASSLVTLKDLKASYKELSGKASPVAIVQSKLPLVSTDVKSQVNFARMQRLTRLATVSDRVLRSDHQQSWHERHNWCWLGSELAS